MKKFTKNDWVNLFKTIGLSDEQMNEWHTQFEKQYPEAHQAFLEWLGISTDEIKRIRNK